MKAKVTVFLIIAAGIGLFFTLPDFSAQNLIPIAGSLSPNGEIAGRQAAYFILHHEAARLKLETDSLLSLNPPGLIVHLCQNLEILPETSRPQAEKQLKAYWTFALKAYDVPYLLNRINEEQLLGYLTDAVLAGRDQLDSQIIR